MRILRLDIAAFGPFTGRVLDFSSDLPGLHLVFGPNEAGKSSSLRALKAWLFGFPVRTSDAFLHPYARLLVGGEIEEQGKRLHFYRRKRNKGDLLDPDGKPLSVGALDPFLHSLDQQLFEALYGIDHDRLVQGGRDILEQRGELGDVLFAASTGVASLHRLMASLDEESGRLFKSGGQLPPINKAIARHRELKKEIRELSLAPERYLEAARELRDVTDRYRELDAARRELEQKIRFLDRIHRATSLISRRRALRRQLAELGQVPPLAPDFSIRRLKVQEQLRDLRLQEAGNRTRLAELKKKLGSLATDRTLLEQESRIEDLYQRVSEYRKAQRDLPRIEGLRASRRREAQRALKMAAPNLELDQADRLGELWRNRERVRRLLIRFEALDQARQDSERRRRTILQRLRQLQDQSLVSPELRTMERLHLALDAARRLGDIDTVIETLERETAALAVRCDQELARQDLWPGTAADLVRLQLPGEESVSRFAEQFRDLEIRLAGQEQAIAETRERLEQLRRDRRELELTGTVPTEEELAAIRRNRDHGWRLIREAWLKGEGIDYSLHRWASDNPADQYEQLVLQADTLADRLRLEAERVHKFASLKADEQLYAAQLAILEEEREKLSRDREQLTLSWSRLWQPLGISWLTPREMQSWLRRMENLRTEVAALEEQQARLRDLTGRRQEHRAALLVLLDRETAPPVPELAPVIDLAGAHLADLEEQQARTREHQRELARQRQLLQEVEGELAETARQQEEWQAQWQTAVSLPDGAAPLDPGSAPGILEAVEKLFHLLEQMEEDSSRIRGINRDAEDFARDVRQLATQLARQLAEDRPDDCAEHLYRLLGQAREMETRQHTWEEQVESLEQELGELATRIAFWEEELEKLLAEAGCRAEQDLAEVERRAAEQVRLREAIQDLETDLRPLAGDQSLDSFEKQVAGEDSDTLVERIGELRREIEQDLEPELRQLAERRGELKRELAQMDGTSQAARRAEELEENLALLREHAERYIQLRLAAGLLRREIDRFREENRDPLLEAASAMFARITLHSFTGLATDIDARGKPVLVGVRGDNQRLGVEAMSTGTRDQLYLCLRLASLLQRAEAGQAMPFIADDILINFDDDRSRAALDLLAEVGQKNQVILFTHHHRMVDLARQADSTIHIHTLEPKSSP
ncbi:AAA family ATPase [Desulfolithobacter sp.]